MNHLKTFESYIKDAINSTSKLAALFSKDDKKTLQDECDQFVNQHINKLNDDDGAVEFTLEYIEFLRYTIAQNNLDLPAYYTKEKRSCETKPYPLVADSGFGKELLSIESLEADETHSTALANSYMHSERKPERLLIQLQERKNTPFGYLLNAKGMYKAVQDKPATSNKRQQLAALAFVMYTYDKLRPLFKDELVAKSDEKPGVGLNRNSTGAGVVASIAALGKLVLPESAFQSQGADTTGCFRTCQRMVGATAPPHLGIKMAKETSSGVVKLPTFTKALETIEQHLAAGKPIIVGVDDKKGSVNHDQTTDHFVVIVGSGKDDNGAFYRFFDPGTSHRDKGTNEENKFYVDSDGLLSGTSAYNKDSKRYTVSWVRPTSAA